MIVALQAEIAKLRGSLILLLTLVAPGMLVVFTLFNLMREGTTWTGAQAMQGAVALWAIFMLPMAVTALASQLAQIEHTNATWDYLLALSVRRAHLFLSKAITLLLIVMCMSLLLFGGVLLDVWLASRFGANITSPSASDVLAQAVLLGKVLGASCCCRCCNCGSRCAFRASYLHLQWASAAPSWRSQRPQPRRVSICRGKCPSTNSPSQRARTLRWSSAAPAA